MRIKESDFYLDRPKALGWRGLSLLIPAVLSAVGFFSFGVLAFGFTELSTLPDTFKTALVLVGAFCLAGGEEHGPLGAWTLTGTVEVGDSSSEPGTPDFPVPVQLADWSLPTEAGPGQPLEVHLTCRALGKIDAY